MVGLAPALSQPGLTAGQFRKVAPNGFGDLQNCYAHSMCWYEGHLYVGTTRGNLANRALQIKANTPDRLGEVWPVPIPNTNWDIDLRAEIWRYDPRAKQWLNVYRAPWATGIDGFQVPISVGFRSMGVFHGPSDDKPTLYVPTWGSHQTPSSLILRCADGRTFEPVSELGEGLPNPKPRSIRGLVSFRGHLVAAPVVGQARFEPNVAGNVVLLSCTDPCAGGWQPAAPPGFGDPNNVSVFQMAVFDDHLYAATMNINEGFQIWKTEADGPPPFRWKKVMSRGAHRGRLNQIAMTLCPFRGALYVGTAIQNCSFDYDYNVGPAAPEIVRIHPDDTWDLVVGEPRLTPDGLKIPLSGLGPAFNNPFAGYLWSMCAHDGWLYAGTGVWAAFLKYRKLPEDSPLAAQVLGTWQDKSTGFDLDDLLARFGGFDLWRTRNGANWSPVTVNGFDNCYNIGVRTQASTEYGLFVGTANPFGPEIARERTAGWKYEYNPTGGLEVWLGAPRHEIEPAHDRTPIRIVTDQVDRKRADEQATQAVDRRWAASVVEAFFGGAGHRQLGCWRADLSGGDAAAENLIEELVAFLPSGAHSLVDLDCGGGATLGYLRKRYSSLLGVAATRAERDACRRRVSDVTVLDRKEFSRELRHLQCDQALWIQRFGGPTAPTSAQVDQCRRLLRPGGVFGFFLTLLPERPRRFALRPRPICEAESYLQWLMSFGFEDVRLVDLTHASLETFRARLARFLFLEIATGQVPSVPYSALETYLAIDWPDGTRCYLATGRQPGGESDTAPCTTTD